MLEFRVWNLTTKSWEEGDKISDLVKFNQESKSFTVSNPFCVIEQTTRKEDKFGNDIYKGDIVKTNDGKLREVDWDEEYLEYILSNSEDSGSLFNYNDLEIVGNIHENAEMFFNL